MSSWGGEQSVLKVNCVCMWGQERGRGMDNSGSECMSPRECTCVCVCLYVDCCVSPGWYKC